MRTICSKTPPRHVPPPDTVHDWIRTPGTIQESEMTTALGDDLISPSWEGARYGNRAWRQVERRADNHGPRSSASGRQARSRGTKKAENIQSIAEKGSDSMKVKAE